MGINWIFFDLDDTLFNFSTSSLVALNRLWEEVPEINSKFPSADAFIDEYHIHNSNMWLLHESGKISSEFLKMERFRLTINPMLEDVGFKTLCRHINDRYLSILGECNAPCPGATDLLIQLQGKYLIGVLTNGFTEVQYKKLRTMGLSRYIQRVVISDEIGVQKPDSKLFRYAENATGANPNSIIMIGDNPINDIQGALDAGWHAIYYDKKGKPFASDSPLYLGKINDLSEVASLLNNLK